MFGAGERCVMTRVERTLARVKALFLQRPNVAFSFGMLCRLTGLDEHAGPAMLNALEHVRFLWRTRDGLFQLRPEPALVEDDERP
jgi:hypothetical protein